MTGRKLLLMTLITSLRVDEFGQESDCRVGHAVLIEPGLRSQSPKNGNISNIRRRLSPISLSNCRDWESRDGAPIWIRPPLAGTSRIRQGTISSCRTAWLGREDSNLEMANWKSGALACPREDAEPLSAEVHK